MIHTFSSSFRGAILPVGEQMSGPTVYMNDEIQINPGVTLAQYSSGATQIDIALLGGPKIGQKWTLYAVSVQGLLAFLIENGLPALGGRLGRILAGVFIGQSVQETTIAAVGDSPYSQSLLPLPKDVTLVSEMWGPETDPMPPSFSNVSVAASNQALPISTTISPPVPRQLLPGEQVGIGVWMEPSLYCASLNSGASVTYFGLQLQQQRYSITYDDGIGV